MKTALKCAAIILAAAIAYATGIIPGGMLPALLGLPARALPDGVTAAMAFLSAFADAMLYTGVLVLLFTGREMSKSRQTSGERQLSGRAPRLWATQDKS
jgi:hypothetical protein